VGGTHPQTVLPAVAALVDGERLWVAVPHLQFVLRQDKIMRHQFSAYFSQRVRLEKIYLNFVGPEGLLVFAQLGNFWWFVLSTQQYVFDQIETLDDESFEQEVDAVSREQEISGKFQTRLDEIDERKWVHIQNGYQNFSQMNYKLFAQFDGFFIPKLFS
jgi:isopentenyldiphosphate isomerase